jgi:hypothetical protein
MMHTSRERRIRLPRASFSATTFFGDDFLVSGSLRRS